jgi:hypothetical protein
MCLSCGVYLVPMIIINLVLFIFYEFLFCHIEVKGHVIILLSLLYMHITGLESKLFFSTHCFISLCFNTLILSVSMKRSIANS